MGNDTDLNNLAMSEDARPLLDALAKHIRENVDPITEEFHRLGEGRAERFSYAPGQLELLETAKNKAREAGLWNFFLPNAETGEGLSNLDYAYIAFELGKNPLASQTLNCSAPSVLRAAAFGRLPVHESTNCGDGDAVAGAPLAPASALPGCETGSPSGSQLTALTSSG